VTDRQQVPLTSAEAKAVLIHMARSLEMSMHPEPDRVDREIIEKLKACIGPDEWAALDLQGSLG
jgi:hypothetical protein